MATNKDDVGPCRCRPTGTLSEEQQVLHDADAAFLELIVAGDLPGVERMISQGQDVNVGDDTQESACHKAMRVKDPAMLKALVKHRGFVDYSDAYGNRPVNVAMQMGEAAEQHMAYVLTLKDSKGELIVNLTALNFKTGNTLVHDAAWVGNTAACEALLKTGAFAEMLETANKQGQTAMHIAAFRAPKVLVTALVEAGAETNVVKKVMWTEEDDEEKWLGPAPAIEVVWDDSTGFLLQVAFSVDAKEKEWTDEMELRDVWQKDLDELGVFDLKKKG